VAGFDTLLSVHGLGENVRMLRDGVLVPRQLYTSNGGKRIKVDAFHDLLSQGVSIVVEKIDRSILQIGQLAAAIEREMGIQTQVNAYLSFSKGGAFTPHWDPHDVLAVQVRGRKRWRFWKAAVPNPVEMCDTVPIEANAAPDQEIELAPGDVLFIPRGEIHVAAVSAECSVHLTIDLRSETGIDFLNHIQKKAVQDPLLRMNLLRLPVNERSNTHETALKRRLHQLIDEASVSEFLQLRDLSRSPAVQTAVSGALPQRSCSVPDSAPAGYTPGYRVRDWAAVYYDRRRGATPLSASDRCPTVAFRSRSSNFACALRRAGTASRTRLDGGRAPRAFAFWISRRRS